MVFNWKFGVGVFGVGGGFVGCLIFLILKISVGIFMLFVGIQFYLGVDLVSGDILICYLVSEFGLQICFVVFWFCWIIGVQFGCVELELVCAGGFGLFVVFELGVEFVLSGWVNVYWVFCEILVGVELFFVGV